MLEGLVAGLLNRFIGPYVTNLNVSQLNIAIWSGNVSFKSNIARTESIFRDLMELNTCLTSV